MPETRHAAGPTRVAVCVATFRRPELLRTLLDALARLSFEKVPKPSVEIIVVDNDAAQSAKPICHGTSFPWSLRYAYEPRRGIVHARNRAIECAIGANFVVFTDDDEVPGTRWLDELLWAQYRFQADVVSGALHPVFANDVPDWVRAGKFFDRPVFATGDSVPLCSTANVLIQSGVFGVVSEFDEQFNLSGGEDTHFFVRVREAGFRMVFSGEAVVHEPITAQRANLSWLVRRGFQAGNGWAHCERSLHPSLGVAILRVCKEFIHVGRGVLHFFMALFAGKEHIVRSLQTISAGVGTLAGVAGYRFLPYRGSQEREPSGPVRHELSAAAKEKC